ncbi:MAG: gluconokinase [Pseudoalteromonas tetraodonis]
MRKTFIFMGVSGCGKSTIARAFAETSGGDFLDGDDFHPPANIEKMSSGIPLDDDDRVAWLAAITDAINHSAKAILCFACSALKKKHRDLLRQASGEITFIYLHGSRELLLQRHAERSGHFMPAMLLDSQLADLETPTQAHRIDITASPEEIIAGLRAQFAL